MPEDSDLRSLILGYFRMAGGVVDEPAYGVTDILLPDETAARLGIEPYLRLAFDDDAAHSAPPGDVPQAPIFLHYGHPLVEQVVEEVRQRAGNTRLHINTVRLDKRGLLKLAEKTQAFSNARVFPSPNASEGRVISHYVCYNFKASLMTDEKREMIFPVWMYLQGGYPVDGSEIERLAPLEIADQFKNIHPSSPLWKPGADPLAKDTLAALFERAQQAALEKLSAGPLEVLLSRARRHLELDQARLTQYYDDLRLDLEKRLSGASEDRRASLQAKLEAVELERQTKLDDAQAKYHPRVSLELINWMIVSQPKISLPVEIRKRSAATTRSVVWDPLLHRLEPLVCDGCSQPSYNPSLCENGHLAHADCLAPQCVDCKRTFCRLCQDQVAACVVCDRPVCLPSLTRCPTCGRGTCREHAGLCHAHAGLPVHLTMEKPEPERQAESPAPALAIAAENLPAQPEQKAAPWTAAPMPAKSVLKSGKEKAAKTKEKAKTPVPKPQPVQRGQVRGQQMVVYAEMSQPVVSAYVEAGKRTLAIRAWELAEDGIHVSCNCEKEWRCQAHGMLLRPESADRIEAQIWGEILLLRQEYGVKPDQVSIYRVVRDQPQHERKLMLFGKWKDKAAIARAQLGYDKKG